MKFIALFFLFALSAARRLPFDPELNTHWENFKKVYSKTYSGKEESARRLIWESNVNDIFHQNLAADMGIHSFKTGINEYSDLTYEEFFSRMNGFVFSPKLRNNNGSVWLAPSNVDLPERVDWREEGLVTPVKNQKACGSCWAFATTGTLEGQHKKKTGNLISLSEQNLVDCSRSEGTVGCNGGLMDQAFNYIKKNHGVDTEDSYPYMAQDGECHFRRDSVGATCTGFVDIPLYNEEALMQAVATIGPIAAAIDASHKEFAAYKSGIFDFPACNRYELDHAILVVGYGTENGKDYWLVKNSWGDSWGSNGYIKMARNKNNQCGIASLASYPLV